MNELPPQPSSAPQQKLTPEELEEKIKAAVSIIKSCPLFPKRGGNYSDESVIEEKLGLVGEYSPEVILSDDVINSLAQLLVDSYLGGAGDANIVLDIVPFLKPKKYFREELRNKLSTNKLLHDEAGHIVSVMIRNGMNIMHHTRKFTIFLGIELSSLLREQDVKNALAEYFFKLVQSAGRNSDEIIFSGILNELPESDDEADIQALLNEMKRQMSPHELELLRKIILYGDENNLNLKYKSIGIYKKCLGIN